MLFYTIIKSPFIGHIIVQEISLNIQNPIGLTEFPVLGMPKDFPGPTVPPAFIIYGPFLF